MEPQNEGLEAEFPFKWVNFRFQPLVFGGVTIDPKFLGHPTVDG